MNNQEEANYILNKKIDCPICGQEFITKQVKTGKARFIGTEDDLRPLYNGIDTVKYDVIQCPNCGYSALTSNFGVLSGKQIEAIRNEIKGKFIPVEVPDEPYSYELAIRRYKLAMITDMAKKAKLSENAYLCLKISWLYRGAADQISQKMEILDIMSEESRKISEYRAKEAEFTQKAYEGFSVAVQREYPPICGMDENTLNYLLAALAVKCNKYTEAKKNAFLVVSSRTASRNLKEKARNLLDGITNKSN